MNESIPALPSGHDTADTCASGGDGPGHHNFRPGHRGSRRRRGFLVGLLVGAIGTGLVGFAIGATMPAAQAALGHLSSRGHNGPPSQEEAVERAEFVVGFALHRLDASEAQEESVQKIVADAITDAFPIAKNHRENRDQLRTILAAPTVDRAAIEKLRVDEMALADELSRVVVAALGDTAEVLTTEQRTELLQHLERFRGRH